MLKKNEIEFFLFVNMFIICSFYRFSKLLKLLSIQFPPKTLFF